MIWILITVLVGLIVILANLLLVYQKRAARLKVAQNPVRKQIDSYKDKLTELGTTVRSTAGSALTQLKQDMAGFTRRSGHAANMTAELQADAEAWAAAHEVDTADFEEDEGEAGEEAGEEQEEEDIIGGRREAVHKVDTGHINPLDLLREIRHELEECYEYMEGLRTDANIVQQTVSRLIPPEDQGKKNGSAS